MTAERGAERLCTTTLMAITDGLVDDATDRSPAASSGGRGAVPESRHIAA